MGKSLPVGQRYLAVDRTLAPIREYVVNGMFLPDLIREHGDALKVTWKSWESDGEA